MVESPAQSGQLRTLIHPEPTSGVHVRIKQWGSLRQCKLRDTEKVGAVFGLHVIAYNLIRLGKLPKPAMAAA